MKIRVQVALSFSQSQNEILFLIFSNLISVATGSKSLLQGTFGSFQIINMAVELGI